MEQISLEYGMIIIGINNNLCINCGECVADCPENLFQTGSATPVVFADPFDRCIGCGHCLAVCPVKAVEYEAVEEPAEHDSFARPEKIIGPDDLGRLLRARRSVRRFDGRDVPAEARRLILDAMRHAPTGSNRQKIHYTVITDRAMIAEFSRRVIGSFRFIRVLLVILRVLWPFSRKKKGSFLRDGLYVSLKNAVRKSAEGKDPVFYHAPCVIVVSATPYAHQAPVDGGIVLTHGMLMAQALGLGTCLVGFAHENLAVSVALRRRLGIPARYRAQGVMAIGYPAVRYLRAPMRNPASMNSLLSGSVLSPYRE